MDASHELEDEEFGYRYGVTVTPAVCPRLIESHYYDIQALSRIHIVPIPSKAVSMLGFN